MPGPRPVCADALRSVVQGQAAGFAGYTLTQTFNNRLQPNTVVATSPSSILLDFTYDFVDANGKNNGNVDGILNNRNHNRDQSFTYDELNRIKTAQSAATSGGDCWGLQYGLDIYANLLSATVTKCTETALSVSVDTKNRITNTGFAYDLSGNATGDGSFSYTWDGESRMKSGAGVNYTYDGDARRAKKSSGKLYWYGIGAEPLAKSDLSGNISEEYVFFGGKRIARRVVSPSSVFYYFADHLGTSRVIVQANATTACYEADNTPYGKERVITDTCPQNYKFTGKERDTESSLDYMGARYYSWSFGRFQSPDLPFIDQHLGNPQSWNLYAYARNNPLIFSDPTGNAVDGPMGGEGMLPGVHHGGGVSPSMLSGTTCYSWGYALLTVAGAESSETTTTSADVQQATQQLPQEPHGDPVGVVTGDHMQRRTDLVAVATSDTIYIQTRIVVYKVMRKEGERVVPVDGKFEITLVETQLAGEEKVGMGGTATNTNTIEDNIRPGLGSGRSVILQRIAVDGRIVQIGARNLGPDGKPVFTWANVIRISPQRICINDSCK